MAAGQVVKGQLLEAVVDHGLDRLRHQSPAPIIPAENVADLTSLQFFRQSRVPGFQAQRADHLSVFLPFQGKGLFSADKRIQNPPGLLHGLVVIPPGHLANAFHAGILIKIRQIRLPPGAQDKALGFDSDIGHINRCIHIRSSHNPFLKVCYHFTPSFPWCQHIQA